MEGRGVGDGRRGRGDVPGAENNPGKLRRVWGFGDVLFPDASHGMVSRDQLTADNIGRHGKRRTDQIHGFLTQGL